APAAAGSTGAPSSPGPPASTGATRGAWPTSTETDSTLFGPSADRHAYDRLDQQPVLRPAEPRADPEIQVPLAERLVDDGEQRLVVPGERPEPLPLAQAVVAFDADVQPLAQLAGHHGRQLVAHRPLGGPGDRPVDVQVLREGPGPGAIAGDALQLGVPRVDVDVAPHPPDLEVQPPEEAGVRRV